MGYAYGTAVCDFAWEDSLIFKRGACVKAPDLIDIVKASVRGYVGVTGVICSPPCGGDRLWPDPNHYTISIDSYFDNGFVAVIGFENRSPECSDYDYDDAYWVVEFSRCAKSESLSCTNAPTTFPLIPPGF
jgi:hypothetical protein